MLMKQKLKDSNNDNIRFKSIRRVELSKQNFNVIKIAYTFKLNENNYLNLLSIKVYNFIYHEEYLSLPFKSTTIDQLPEIDKED
ncbi:hypothetical protein QTP88_028763 [Uroleucon formosanum]